MTNNNLRIIIIDDNPAIHQDFIKVLATYQHSSVFKYLDQELFGNKKEIDNDSLPVFQIDTARQGQEGIEKIKLAIQEDDPYALAFVDIRMPPGWDGLETIKRMWKIDPDIQAVICTAYSDYSWEETVAKLGMSDNLLILKKPFDKVAVRQLACALTKKWLLAKESKNHMRLLNDLVDERTSSLQQSLSLLRATIESSNDGILVVSLKEEIVDYNNQFIKLWSIPDAIIKEKNNKMLLNFMQEKLIDSAIWEAQINFVHEHPDEILFMLMQLKGKKTFECYSCPHLVSTTIVGRVWSFRDITERVNLEDALEFQATHDPLTKLPNRVLMSKRILDCMEQAAKMKNYCALLFFDLDRFKLINDSLSHEVGDKILFALVKRLSGLLRKGDTLARLGGDEFVIIIPDLQRSEDAVSLAQKIITSFDVPFYIRGREISMSTSMGISIYPTDGKTINTLLKNADLAMYKAKGQGGNQFQFYTSRLNLQVNKRLQQETDLRHAITNKEFFLLYQPQFDYAKKQMIGAEALIRWQHPVKGLILPFDFIPIAEESGLIIMIGEWVLREVCRQIAEWQKAGLPPIYVAVNVTTNQLKQQNFVTKVQSILNEYKVDPRYLEVEITENVIISNMEIQRMIQQLKKIGVKIVLDDFGTGNSSLNYLKKIQIDRLKIDQSFIQNIAKSRSDEVIIEAIIAMAGSLNFKVLAEGVETQKQLNFLRSKNCTEVQGFLYSKPVSPLSIAKLLKK